MIHEKTLMGSATLTWEVNTRDQTEAAASKAAEVKELLLPLCSICGVEVMVSFFFDSGFLW